MKLVSKVAGKKSRWKVVEKEFVQGKDVSKYDAWKLILLSDLFPKVKIKTTNRIFTIQTVFSFVLYNVNGIFTEHLIRV